MKTSLKLLEYSFERLDIQFPKFPGKGGSFTITGLYGSLIRYRNKKRKNVSAVKWELRTKTKEHGVFRFNFVIIGEFDHGVISERKKQQMLQEEAVPILFDIAVSATSRIMNHSTVSGNPLTKVDIRKVKFSNKPL